MKISDLQQVKALSVKRKALAQLITGADDGCDIIVSMEWPDASVTIQSDCRSAAQLLQMLRQDLADVEALLVALGVVLDAPAVEDDGDEGDDDDEAEFELAAAEGEAA